MFVVRTDKSHVHHQMAVGEMVSPSSQEARVVLVLEAEFRRPPMAFFRNEFWIDSVSTCHSYDK